MDTQLLSTKLNIPAPRPDLVSRHRLIERLDNSIEQGQKLILLSAAAGFGKTTLLSEWSHQVNSAYDFAYISLDDYDNDLNRFMTYTASAFDKYKSGIKENIVNLLQSSQSYVVRILITALINDLAVLPKDTVLIFDDYQVIEADQIHEAITTLLEYLPSQVHIVIATRSDPPLPLARLRARGQLTELRSEDLRFTVEETASFLNQSMGLGLTASEIHALDARAEGWVAGLQLAALALQSSPLKRTHQGTSEFITAFTGSNHFILDFLAEEVLRNQPESIRTFLLFSSILNRLCGSLCDAVVYGIFPETQINGKQARSSSGSLLPRVSPSQAMLEILEKTNLFTIQIDETGPWYRYHRLFEDFLNSHLTQQYGDQVEELHCRAAIWYESQGYIPEAIDHAIKARNYDRVVRLVESGAEAIFLRGEITTFVEWIKSIPKEYIFQRPKLEILNIWSTLASRNVEAIPVLLENLEEKVKRDPINPEYSLLSGQILALKAFLAATLQGDHELAVTLSREAARLISPETSSVMGIGSWILALTYQICGEVDSAERIFSNIIKNNLPLGNIFSVRFAIYSMALQKMIQGRLQQAKELLRHTIFIENDIESNEMSMLLRLSYQLLGEICLEQNNLDEAMEYLERSLDLSQRNPIKTIHKIDELTTRINIFQAQKEYDKALACIEQARQFSLTQNPPPWAMRRLEATQARLWIAKGDLEKARLWARMLETSEDQRFFHKGTLAMFVSHFEHMTMIRLLIAEKQYGEAEKVIRSLLELIDVTEWRGLFIEILAFQSVVMNELGNSSQAIKCLDQSLSFAEPENYIRVYIEIGPLISDLLHKLKKQGKHPLYIDNILTALHQGSAKLPAIQGGQLEQLSERERKVLKLIAAGLSNQDIADELVVSVSTIKTHINHIYEKLGVPNRTQAAMLAREHGLN